MDLFPQEAPDITEFMQANPHSFGPEMTLGGDTTQGQYVYEKDKSIGMFYARAVPNIIKSRETGRPEYMRVPYIQIRQPGEQLNIVDRPAQPVDKARFSLAWERFVKRSEQGAVGTPLEALFPYHPEIVMTLKSNSVPTVEALADVTDTAVAGMPFGGTELRAKAQRYLLAITNPDGVAQVKQAEEIEQLKAANRDLQALLDSQKAAAQSLESRLAALEQTRGGADRLSPGEGDLAAGNAIAAQQAAQPARRTR